MNKTQITDKQFEYINKSLPSIKNKIKNKLIININPNVYDKIDIVRLYELIRAEIEEQIAKVGSKNFSLTIGKWQSAKNSKIKKIRKGKITDEKYLDKE